MSIICNALSYIEIHKRRDWPSIYEKLFLLNSAKV
jgi:hypothetical protein